MSVLAVVSGECGCRIEMSAVTTAWDGRDCAYRQNADDPFVIPVPVHPHRWPSLGHHPVPTLAHVPPVSLCHCGKPSAKHGPGACVLHGGWEW